MFVLMVLAVAAVVTFAWAAGRGERPGRHQRSPLGPIRGDGSGWTQEGVTGQLPASTHREAAARGPQFRGPEDDPAFMAQLARQNRANRREPPDSL